MDKKKNSYLSLDKKKRTHKHTREPTNARRKENIKKSLRNDWIARKSSTTILSRAFVCLRAASRLLFVCRFGRGYFSTLLEEFASSFLCVCVCSRLWEKLERRTRGIPIRLPFSSSSTETNSKRAVNLLRVYSPEESVDRDWVWEWTRIFSFFLGICFVWESLHLKSQREKLFEFSLLREVSNVRRWCRRKKEAARRWKHQQPSE